MTEAAEGSTRRMRRGPAESVRPVIAVATFEDSLESLLADGYRVALAILRHPQEAEDAVQDAAMGAWRKRHQLRHTESPRAWFLTAVTNTCRMRLRSRWWRQGRAVGSDPTLDQVEAPRHEPSVEWAADLEHALLRLSWSQRAVLAMYYQLDLPQEEIARVLGVRVGTVKSRLSRATAALRTAVNKEEN